MCIGSNYHGGIYPIQFDLFLSFEEAKKMAIDKLSKELEKLNKEFEEL